VRVSILIPTLNAGPIFARSLDAIRAQRGIPEVELLVRDSGSRDETVALAAQAGARLIDGSAAEFNHGRARQELARLASGEVLVLMVQDAVLVGRRALRDLVRGLDRDARLAAVTARQVAGHRADPFGRYQLALHMKALASKTPPSGEPGRRSRDQLLTDALIDDVCAAVRRSAWEQLGFGEVEFAEDIDLGLRAIENGWRTGFVSGARVVHHHDRDAAYVLCRSAVHRLHVASLLHDPRREPAAGVGLAGLAARTRTLLREVEGAGPRSRRPGQPVVLARYADLLARRLAFGGCLREPRGELAVIDRLLYDEPLARPGELRDVRRSVLRLLGWWRFRFFTHRVGFASADQAQRFVARAIAAHLGRAFGDAMLATPDAPLARRLRAGLT
jgi:rhamnosyltransferase